MLDLSFAEFLFIAVFAVLFLGPKEFPVMIKQLVRWVGELKAFGDDMRQQITSIADESGLLDVKKEIEEETGYIIDQNGEYQKTYDISEFLEKDRPTITNKESHENTSS